MRTITNFFSRYRIGSALKRAGAYKERGVPVLVLVKYLVALIYTGRSMFQDMRSAAPYARGFSKDAVYRLLNRATINWQAFLLHIANQTVEEIDKLTSEERRSAFVIDDTLYQVPHAKKAELVSKVYDHAEKAGNKFKWGFRMLALGWTDGVTFIPLAFRHLASSDVKNQRQGMAPGLDKRCRAYKIRKEALSKAPEVMLALLKAAVHSGIKAKHVLFDSWFAYPVTIIKIWALGLSVTARVKNTATIKYLVGDKKMTLSEIYRVNRKRRGKSRYLLSVLIVLTNEENKKVRELPARIVYVRNKNNRSKWIALISSDLSLTEEEIVELYGKRWDIEVFFKVCKSYLKLTSEFQQLSYDALTAHTAIVMLRYMILSVEKRRQEDRRSMGELYHESVDEMGDIKFEQSLFQLINLLVITLKDDGLGLTEELAEKIMDNFIANLPLNFQRCLYPILAA
jgi:hypothetical protein